TTIRALRYADGRRDGRTPPRLSLQNLHPRDPPLVEREAQRQRAAVGLNHRERVAVVSHLDSLEVHRGQLSVDAEAGRDERQERLDHFDLRHETRSSRAEARATTLSRL